MPRGTLLLAIGAAAALHIGAPPSRPRLTRHAGLHLTAADGAAPRAAANMSAWSRQQDFVKRLELSLASGTVSREVADLEEHARACEVRGDLEGAIAAYEALLALEPPTSAELAAQQGARRGLQELLLESARRELEACEADEGCLVELSLMQRAQIMGEDARRQLATRALSDVGRLREAVVSFFEASTSQAEEDASKAEAELAYLRLVEGDPGWLAGWQLNEATRRIEDSRLLRKSIEADLSRLELQLLQGDPSLAFIRESLLGASSGSKLAPPESLWLKEQIERGALPADPELLRTLLEQARTDPSLVERLVTQAKDDDGLDLYSRRRNDPAAVLADPEIPIELLQRVGMDESRAADGDERDD